jgi:predicted outer membrane protein
MAKQRQTFFFLCLLGLLSLAGLLAQAGRNGGEVDEASFLEKAACTSLLQVRMGTVAARQAGAREVVAFAGTMVTEFVAIGEEIRLLRAQGGPVKLSSADESTVGYLGTLPGAALDREYTSIAIDELEELVKAFRTQRKTAADSRVKGFADRTLPRLEGFLRDAERVLDGLPRPVLK